MNQRENDKPATEISCDDSLLDLDVIHGFLSTCYWSPGIARARVQRAIAHSLCIGAYDHTQPRADGRPGQIGFARVVTDRATFAYLCDVFVLPAHRGRGVSKRLMQAFVDHPDLAGVRRLCLMTRDAHGLYQQFGFGPMPDPARYMERTNQDAYKNP